VKEFLTRKVFYKQPWNAGNLYFATRAQNKPFKAFRRPCICQTS